MNHPALPRLAALAVLMMTAALWGCSPGDDKGKTEKKADAPPPPKAAPAPAPAPAPKKEAPKAKGPGVGWTLLGQEQADRKTEKERIKVGNKEGRFKELAITVDGASVSIESMTVTLGNDEVHKIAVGQQLNEGQTSRPIDVPGKHARVIRHVDFVYRTTDKGQGKATVTLYGR